VRIRTFVVLVICCFHGIASAASGKSVLAPPRHGGVYVVAHRGAHQGIPENSLPAYQKAIVLGVDFVEVDARQTRDGHFVSVHDSTVDAYTDGATGRVRDFTLAELQAFDIGARIGPEWKGTRIPTVDEILTLCKGKVGIYMDFKEGDWETLLRLVRLRGMERQVLWYAPYWKLEKIQKACSKCLIMPDPGPEEKLVAVLEKFHPKVTASVWKHYSEGFAKACHERGSLVIVDESDPSCWEQALVWQTDGLQTDHPEKLVAFLKNRDNKDPSRDASGGTIRQE
jgi:glycerophosphoryl diester phosphodiesterase